MGNIEPRVLPIDTYSGERGHLTRCVKSHQFDGIPICRYQFMNVCQFIAYDLLKIVQQINCHDHWKLLICVLYKQLATVPVLRKGELRKNDVNILPRSNNAHHITIVLKWHLT